MMETLAQEDTLRVHWEIGYEIQLDAVSGVHSVASIYLTKPDFEWPTFYVNTVIHYIWRYLDPPTTEELVQFRSQDIAVPVEDWTLEMFDTSIK